ncbi:MAG: YraN family protein [Actinomycetota bacterium]|nr:YraN family protein [Actinomycetota bacterium]
MSSRRPGHLALGRTGELIAARWYQQRGGRIVARNHRCREGELDLVVAEGRVLVFVEVKARRSLAFGHPAEAVDAKRQVRLRRAAASFLASSGRRPSSIRFDVAAVLPGRIEVVHGAF